MELVFKERCGCGGQIHMITCVEDGVRYASHGVCDECLREVPLPWEPLDYYKPLLTEGSSIPRLR